MRKYLLICIIGVMIMTQLCGAADSPVSELRGIWLRPPEDIKQIPLMLDDITSAGFNLVLVETFYHGHTLSPSLYVPQRPEFKGHDVMNIFIDEAHRRRLKIHAWTEVFYWQVDTEEFPQLPQTNLFDLHPDWLLRLRDGSTTEKTEYAHIFANPAHPRVHSFLIRYYEELIKKYDLDGLNLDYIRYPAGSQDAGYDEYSRKAFKEAHGIDPIDIDSSKMPELWQKWVEWRENQVTELVKKLHELVKSERPKLVLSAAIFPGYYRNRYADYHFQNWADWIKNSYLDVIIPMAYASSLEGIKAEIMEVKKRLEGSQVELIPALAASRPQADRYGSPAHPELSEQIALVRSLGLKGHTVFCYSWLRESRDAFKALRAGAYKQSNK